MAHIHISLVGGQAYPAYLAIKALNPDKAMLIHSAQSMAEAERIKKELDVETELVEFDSVQLHKIDEGVKALMQSIPGDALCTINLTSGTKPWSLLFYQNFQGREKTEFFYVDQNNTLYDLRTFERYSTESIPLDMDALFRLNGNPAKSKIAFTDYNTADLNTMKSIEKVRNKYPQLYSRFTLLSSAEKKIANQREGKIVEDNGSFIEWNRLDSDGLQTLNLEFCRYDVTTEKQLHSPHAVELFFNCHWFELKVAEILSKWDKAKAVWMNVEFPYRNNAPKNEIDVIVETTMDKLLFVECKTQISDNTDIDKFASAVKNYGGMASKSLFVTLAPMQSKAIEKCETNRVLSFSLTKKSQGGLPREVDEKVLYDRLDKDLTAINKN